jgi:poly(3-hydroxybutyrate) depolymerase
MRCGEGPARSQERYSDSISGFVDRFSQCLDGGTVTHYQIQGGEHRWYGEDPDYPSIIFEEIMGE